MITAFCGYDEHVAEWVQKNIEVCQPFENYTTLGVLDNDKRLIAGIVYTKYTGHTIEVSAAASTPRWCIRPILYAVFAYPFLQLCVGRLQATITKQNKHSRRFVIRLGFKYEGTARKSGPNGEDVCLYSMLLQECPWLKGEVPNV